MQPLRDFESLCRDYSSAPPELVHFPVFPPLMPWAAFWSRFTANSKADHSISPVRLQLRQRPFEAIREPATRTEGLHFGPLRQQFYKSVTSY